ncbi:hypothetical protein DFH09DRAFT_1356535 [Mycena vulgaris]|nr:hypothetical protein DFH09DRAFT_1356535 [Mycena vulgaris]
MAPRNESTKSRSTGLPRDVERGGGPTWQGASSGTPHRPVLRRGITDAVLHQDRHAGDLGIPPNHQGNFAAADVAYRPSTKPLTKATDAAASRSPCPTPPTALNVINIINATQLRWTQRRRRRRPRALGGATPLPPPPPKPPKPPHGSGGGGDDGRH